MESKKVNGMNCMINDLLLNSTDTIAPMDRRNNSKTATNTPIAAEFLKKKSYLIF